MTTRRFALLVIIVVVLFMLLGVAGVYLLVGRGAAPLPTPQDEGLLLVVTQAETVSGTAELPTPTGALSTQPGLASPTAAVTATSGLPSPTPTTALPTSTGTSTPPPGLCSQLDLRFLSATSNVTRWRLENGSSQVMVISRIETTWPESNDAIFNAFLDGKVIWSSEDLVPPTIMTTWFGGEADRQLQGVMSLEFFFGTQAAVDGYDLHVRFSNGCEVEALR